MGIRLFKKLLIKFCGDNYKLEPSKFKQINTDCLLVDFNMFFYQQKYPEHSKMLTSVKQELTKLVQTCNPSKILYVALDGVTPRSKMNISRSRRFNFKLTPGEFDFRKLSPGTEFMDECSANLKSYLLKLFEEREKSDHSEKMKYFYSSHKVPGEGEQKLFTHLRDNPKLHKKNICIYSNDSDLTVMALMLDLPNIYMYDHDESKGFTNILSLSLIKKSLIKNMQHLTANKNSNGDRLVKDFTFICMFFGTDFIPPIVPLHLTGKTEMMLWLVRRYCEFFKKTAKHIAEGSEINLKVLAGFLEYLYAKDSFYRYYYDSSSYDKNVHPKKYIEGLIWSFKYFHNDLISWDFNYTTNVPPRISELIKALKTMEFSKRNFSMGQSPTSMTQILSTIPIGAAHLLPKDIQRLVVDKQSPLESYYPTKYIMKEEGTLFYNYIDNTSQMPYVDIKKVQSSLDKNALNLTEDYKRLCKVEKCFVIKTPTKDVLKGENL